LKSFHAKLEL